MKTRSFRAGLALAGVLAVLHLVSCSASDGTAAAPSTPLAAGNESVAAFDSLPAARRAAVKTLKIFFQHASVGNNVYEGIADLAAIDANCAIATTQTDVASLKEWLASNSGWGDYYLGNPGWSEKIAAFRAAVDDGGIGSVANVAMMKFCFIDNEASFADYRDAMLALESKFPAVVFIWWTMPICIEGDGDNAARNAFNSQIRDYAAQNGKWLFDLADVECHDGLGTRLVDSNGSEILCADYASDSSGHLSQAGRDRAAKAMWTLLSAIAESR